MRGAKTGGRTKGTPNKFTASVKEAFHYAFDGIGGAKGLRDWAKENPTEFYKLFARLIPQDVQHSGSLTFEGVSAVYGNDLPSATEGQTTRH